MDYSVSEYAKKKALSRGRVHQLIKAGEINAHKVGNQWVIPGHEISRNPKSGRSFSPRMALAFLNYISQLENQVVLDPVEIARLKERKIQLKKSADPANLLRSWLKNRAELLELSASDKDFENLFKNKNFLISGAHDPNSGLSGSSIFEGYVERKYLKDLIQKHLLVKSSNPNVKIRIIDELPNSLPLGYLLADLSDNYGSRERSRVKEIIREL